MTQPEQPPFHPETPDTPELPDRAITARGLGLTGSSPVFSDVDLDVPTGGGLIVIGPEGSGKTALLLALTGRMKFTAGTATVDGLDVKKQARAVRRIAALGPVKDVTDLDENLTVEQHVAERIIMFNPWYKPFAAKATVEHTVKRMRSLSTRVAHLVIDQGDAARTAPHGGDFAAKTYVGDLSDIDRFMLSLALALIGQPGFVGVDDIDLLRRRIDRLKAWLYVLAAPQILGEELDPAPLPIVTCEDASEMAEAVATIRRLGLHVPPLEFVRLAGPHDPGHTGTTAITPDSTPAQEA